MEDVITLAGRRFVAVADLTVGQHLHYDRLVMAAGLREVTRGPGESEKAFEDRILSKMLDHEDTILELIGTFWIPEGMDPKRWKPKVARETAELLATLPGKDHLDLVHNLFAHAYLHFFVRGLSSSSGTSTSSVETQPETALGPEKIDTGNGEPLSVN